MIENTRILRIQRGLSCRHIFNNRLSGTIPPDFGMLQSLGQPSLDNNQLNGTILFYFGNLQSLPVPSLSNNLFSGTTLPSDLGKLQNLQVPYLGIN